jgi:CxxC-x17-CxxC domain-containing protein
MSEVSNEITIFAETNFRNTLKSFGIKRDDRRRHVYIIGKTGMGKTTLLENMIISDIVHGEGCCYIDPHGDTAEKILNYIPSSRVNDVIYINPADSDFPIAFNILEAVDESHKHLIASGIVGVFKKQFAESWGPRLEYILRNAVLALLDYPGSTLLGIMRILVDKDYRDKVIDKIKDPVVRSFWTNEYSKWNERTLQEVISPIQNKVGQFLSNFLIRNIVGQVKSTLDLREIMDKKKILIMNLSKGRIGEDTMQLLGSMIVTKLYMAAMSRVDIPEKERPDFYLYVDEFQNFATDSFASILSEARKYRLDLTVAHQYIEQLPETVSAAIFGNVGTLICFRVGAADAEELVKEFTPFFVEEDLVNLPAFAIYLKLMIDGISSDPFSANTLPPLFDEMITDNVDKVIKVSRERYAHPRSVVEDKINRWSGLDLSEKLSEVTGQSREGNYTPAPRMAPRAAGVVADKKESSPIFSRKPRDDRFLNNKAPIKPKSEANFSSTCSLCGREAKLNFEPDPSRPVFCDDCFSKVKEDRRKKKDDRKVILPEIDEAPPKNVTVKAKPISLGEALSRPPVSFKANNKPLIVRQENKPEQKPIQRQPDKIEKPKIITPAKPSVKSSFAPQPEVKDSSKLEWYEEAKKALESARSSGNAPKTQSNDDDKITPNKLGPGEIIKLD